MTDVTDQVTKILSGVTVDGAGGAFAVPRGTPQHAFHGTIAGTGAVSATLTIEGSNDGETWVPALVTMSLTGTTNDVKGGSLANSPYAQLRARVASISGTGAAVSCWMAI